MRNQGDCTTGFHYLWWRPFPAAGPYIALFSACTSEINLNVYFVKTFRHPIAPLYYYELCLASSTVALNSCFPIRTRHVQRTQWWLVYLLMLVRTLQFPSRSLMRASLRPQQDQLQRAGVYDPRNKGYI